MKIAQPGGQWRDVRFSVGEREEGGEAELGGEDLAEDEVKLGAVVIERGKKYGDGFVFGAMLREVAANPAGGEEEFVALGGSDDGSA